MDSPEAALAKQPKLQFWKRALQVSIGLVILPPLFGCAKTVMGMVNAFGTLSAGGENDPGVLAGDVSGAITSTAIGLVISVVIGLPMLILSLVKFLQLRNS